MYKQVKAILPDGNSFIANIVIKEDGANIPFDPSNTDYQAYLKWLDEGNTPLPADEVV
jgi:hypothetical protein